MNREMAEIIRNQEPLILRPHATVREACKHMHDRRVGAVLATDDRGNLLGIFTGRDAVRVIAQESKATTLPLEQVMTKQPALRLMRVGGFRHVPVVENGVLIGVVSRGDFRGLEQDRLDEETGLWERIG